MTRRTVAARVSFAVALATATAHADADSDLEGLLDQTIVETASKSAETASTAPATSTIITAEDIARFHIRTIDEAINFLSLGMVSTNPLHSVEVGARGVLLTSDFGNHVLLLVDGHVMNEQWDGTAYFERGAAIPIELVDHIEIVLGPGSVLYGSNAMLGVINVITKRAKDFAGGRVVVESEVPTSLRGAVGYGQEFRLFGRPAEVTFEAEYYTHTGPSFGFGPQAYGTDAVTGLPKRFNGSPNGTGVWGGSADHSYYTRVPAAYARLIVGDVEISARAATYKRATPYVNGFNQTVGDFDAADNYELDRWLSLDIKHRIALSSVVDLRTRLYGDTYDFQQYLTSHAPEDCFPGQNGGCRRKVLGVSRWAGLETQGTFDWARDGRFVTLLGADGRVRHVGQKTDIVDLDSGANPGSVGAARRTESLLGVFLQQTARPTRSIGLNAGARLDLDERFGSALSPRVAATWSSWEGATWKAVYSEAFRAPTLYELSYVDPSAQIAATSLRAERVRSVEASLEQRFGRQRVLFGVFRSWWRDMVSLEGLSQPELAAAIASGQLEPGVSSATQYRNVSTIDNYGWNAAYEGALVDRRLRYGLNMTGAWARRTLPDGASLPLAVAPQLFGNARVSYDLDQGLPVVALVAAVTGRAPADRAFDGGFTPTPFSPVQVMLRGALTGPMPGVPKLSYRLSATWSAASSSAYVVGPNQAASPTQPAAQLAPVDRFRSAVGLQYEF